MKSAQVILSSISRPPQLFSHTQIRDVTLLHIFQMLNKIKQTYNLYTATCFDTYRWY